MPPATRKIICVQGRFYIGIYPVTLASDLQHLITPRTLYVVPTLKAWSISMYLMLNKHVHK